MEKDEDDDLRRGVTTVGPVYELVLTDFRLPDSDGLQVLSRVRQSQPDAEVILLTSFGSIPLAVEAIKQGAYDFVAKPVKRADLERIVTRALEPATNLSSPLRFALYALYNPLFRRESFKKQGLRLGLR